MSWLRIAQLEAQGRKVAPYSASTFRKVLRDIRSLTAHGDPNDIVDLCATAGVVVVFVSEVKGCRISGAAWWTSPYRAVIALSDRYKKDDRFWFSFFHEAAHILLHSKKETFVDDDTDDDAVGGRGKQPLQRTFSSPRLQSRACTASPPTARPRLSPRRSASPRASSWAGCNTMTNGVGTGETT